MISRRGFIGSVFAAIVGALVKVEARVLGSNTLYFFTPNTIFAVNGHGVVTISSPRQCGVITNIGE